MQIAECILGILTALVGACIFAVLNAVIYRDSHKISVRFAGLWGAVIALIVVSKYRFTFAAMTVFVFFCLLTIVAFVDWNTMEIPNGLVVAVLIIGVISIGTIPELVLWERLCGFLIISVPMLVLALVIPGAFGGGDIKLMAASGILLGWKLSVAAMVLAVFTGGIYGIGLLIRKQKSGKDYFAFGPFLCLGMMIALLW